MKKSGISFVLALALAAMSALASQGLAVADVIGPPCGLGSHRDSYALAASTALAQKLGFPPENIRPLFGDANCSALGRTAGDQASNGDHCKQSYTEARDHGLQNDGNYGDGSTCANLGYEAGMAALRSKARTHSLSSECGSAYDQGVSAQCTGSTSFGASNNIQQVCYQTGSWDASESPALCNSRPSGSSTSTLNAKPGESGLGGAGGGGGGVNSGLAAPRH